MEEAQGNPLSNTIGNRERTSGKYVRKATMEGWEARACKSCRLREEGPVATKTRERDRERGREGGRGEREGERIDKGRQTFEDI